MLRRWLVLGMLAVLTLTGVALAQQDPISGLYGALVLNPGVLSAPAIWIDANKLAAAGQVDSHWIQQIGRSYDTAVHQADWRRFVDVTSNAGASTLTYQSRIDAAAYAARLTVTDGGIVGAPGGVIIGGTSPLTITNVRLYTLTNVDLDTTDNSIAAHVCEDQTVTVTGLLATDNVIVTMTSNDLAITFNVQAHSPATDSLKFRVCNNSAGAADPGAVADFRVLAFSGT